MAPRAESTKKPPICTAASKSAARVPKAKVEQSSTMKRPVGVKKSPTVSKKGRLAGSKVVKKTANKSASIKQKRGEVNHHSTY